MRGNLDTGDVSTHSEIGYLENMILNYALPKIAGLNIGDIFELKELIGSDWDNIGGHGDRNRAGRLFKKLIISGQIKNVRFVETRSNRHALYQKTA